MYRRKISKWAVLCVMWTAPLQAWWSMGHRLVGYIGEKKLDPETRALLEPLLKQPIEPYNPDFIQSLSSFPDAAIWLDYVKNNRIPDLHKSHYINTPLSLEEVGQTLSRAEVMSRIQRTCANSQYNVIQGLNWSMYQLAGYFTDQQVTPERAAALRYFLHLMGDLHQPLHVISLIFPDGQDDEGGNKLRLTESIGVENLDHQVQKINKLHMIWDSAIGSITQDAVPSATKPRSDRLAVLEQTYQDLEQKFGNLPTGEGDTISEWAVSTFLIAQTQIYQKIRVNLDSQDERGHVFVELLTSATQYQNTVAPIAQQAIWQGGVHLAEVLNALRDKKFEYPFLEQKGAPML